MEIRITSSVARAMEVVIQLMHGTLGPEPCAPRPSWCAIPFFGKIVASPIRRTGRVEPKKGETTGYWELAREVEFFHRDVRVAMVKLVGRKLDGAGKLDDSLTFWGVEWVEYASMFFNLPDRTEGWRGVKLSGSLGARGI